MASILLLQRPSTSTSTARTVAVAVPALARAVSSSPYGRTHVWMTRKPKIPNPVVPTFTQRVVRADGSTFLHRSTSPKPVVRLTRDVTNNPLYNNGVAKGGLFGDSASADDEAAEVEDPTSGMSRFTQRFEDLGRSSVAWLNELHEQNASEAETIKAGSVMSAAEAAGSSEKKKRK